MLAGSGSERWDRSNDGVTHPRSESVDTIRLIRNDGQVFKHTPPPMMLRAVLLIAPLFASSCNLGQRALRNDYPQYNQTIRDIEDEHMLLNLVRMRYLETPVFLQISSISTTYGLGANTNGSVTGGGDSSGTVGVGGSYSETPTITYSLPESREFFGRMVAPLSSSQLAVLAMGGTGGFFRMGVKRINRLENISSYTGWEATTPATYGEFEEAMDLLEELERDGLLDVAINIVAIEASSPFDELNNLRAVPEAEAMGMEFWKNADGEWVAYYGIKAPHLRLAAAPADDPRVSRLRQLLNLSPDQYTYPVVDVDFSKTEKDRLVAGLPAAALDPTAEFTELVLANRSMMEVLLYASKSVQVPPAHIEAGLVLPEESVLGELFTVRSSTEEPTNVAVKVQHHGSWFYIAANDLKSKMTLGRLNAMFATTAGTVPGSKPVLTLPVN